MGPSPDSLKLTVFVLVFILMFAAESLWPKRAWLDSRLKRLMVHIGVAGLNTLIVRFLVAGPLMLWVSFLRGCGFGLSSLLGLEGRWEILASFVLFDAFDYWWHRLNHRVRLLWRFHRVHHMDTRVDVTTSLRFHFGELVFSGLAKAAWIAFWGPSLWGFVLGEVGITAAAQFHHSNLDFSDRVEAALRRLAMTPRVHASHHTVTLRSRDANFATIFSVWDRLFNTFQEPDLDELRRLGLPEGRESYLSLPKMLVAPFV